MVQVKVMEGMGARLKKKGWVDEKLRQRKVE